MENTRVIRGTEELARGELDNVTLDEGGVVLDQADGDYLAYGCYTTTRWLAGMAAISSSVGRGG